MHDDVIEPGPVQEALSALRTFVPADYTTTSAADDELAHRMRTLRLALAATNELLVRGDETTSGAIREEMFVLGEEFAFDPALLLEAAGEARGVGAADDARMLTLAYEWHRAMFDQQRSR